MKKSLPVFVLISLLFGCTTTPETVVSKAPWPPYWEGTAPSGTRISLLGTVHLGKKENYPLAAPIEAAIDKSTQGFLEISTEEMNDQFKALELFRRYSLLPEGQTLKTKLLPAQWDRLKAEFKKNNVDLEVYKGFKPWALMVILAGVQAQTQGLDRAWGTEAYLLERFKPRGIQMEGLETMEQQFQTLDNWPESEQLKTLETEGTESDSVTLEALNQSEVIRLLAEMKSKTPELYKRLVIVRNQTMAQTILLQSTGQGQIFFAVGSAHLLGEQSIPDLLEAQGVTWTLRPTMTP